MIAFGVMLGYAIQFFVAIQIIFPILTNSSEFIDKHPVSTEIVFRALMVLVTLAVAELMPNASLLLSFVGSVGCIMLAFVFPTLTELIVLHSRDDGIGIIYWIKNIIVLLIAVVAFTFGGGISIKHIIINTM